MTNNQYPITSRKPALQTAVARRRIGYWLLVIGNSLFRTAQIEP
jgi:hypothetical protein